MPCLKVAFIFYFCLNCRSESKTSKLKRIGLIGAASVSGGVLLGLSGGLAAPLLGIGLGALFGTNNANHCLPIEQLLESYSLSSAQVVVQQWLSVQLQEPHWSDPSSGQLVLASPAIG